MDGSVTYDDDPRAILQDALRDYREALSADRDNREAAQDDLHFLAGEQWDERVLRDRLRDGRPTLTINRLPQFVRQVTGDIRLNKPAIVVRPVDGGADSKTAATFSGLIRNIESISDADTAYIQAAEHAVSCGMGHFRVATRYVAEDAWDQEIRIEPIRNPFAVVWDPQAARLTRDDARYCFVLERMERETFKRAFPQSSASDMDRPVPADWREWRNTDSVLVAEYWVRKPIAKTMASLPSGETLDVTDAGEEELAALTMGGARLRQVETHKICSYLISAGDILAGPFDWPGKYIPIIPVIGAEIILGDRVIRHGLVRFAKDAQRMYNYHRSAAVEAVALAPKAPWVATPEQVKNFEADWARANQDNLSVLLYNPDPQANGPPSRVAPAPVPAALLQESALSSDEMKSTTGIYDAALGARSNETSGRAIMARQREGDVGTYHYIDNLAKAIAHCGRILVDLIPRIYDTERVTRVLGEDGASEAVRLNVETPDGRRLNDLSVGRYDVTVKTGPSFSTRREESAQAMLEFMRVYPQAAPMLGDMLADAMDWPGANEIAARLRALLPPGVAEKAKAEAKGEEIPPEIMQQMQRPSPEQMQAMADMQAQQQKMELEREKFAADIALERARLELDRERLALERAKIEAQYAMKIAETQAKQAPQVGIMLGPDTEAAMAGAQSGSAAAVQEMAASVQQAVGAVAQASADMAATAQQVASMGAQMAEAARVMAAPKRVVRDAQGRAIGVEPVSMN
jgi:hypothetical protein